MKKSGARDLPEIYPKRILSAPMLIVFQISKPLNFPCWPYDAASVVFSSACLLDYPKLSRC